jgi:hypothetical protein
MFSEKKYYKQKQREEQFGNISSERRNDMKGKLVEK